MGKRLNKRVLMREIIPAEMLPRLEKLLNASRMRAVFARALPGPCQIEDCAIVSTKYRPGKNLLISYQLSIADPATGQTRNQLVTLSAPGERDGGNLLAHADGERAFHLPELEAVAWVFPHDRKLTGLGELLDSDNLSRRLLPELVSGNFGSEWSIVNLVCSPVSYRPERACTIRVDLSLRHQRTGAVEARVLYGKTYCFDEGEFAWRRVQSLWQSEARREGRLSLSRPLAYQAQIKTLWQCGMEGRTLNEYEVGSRHFNELLAKAGSTVAELHRTTLATAPLVTPGIIASKLEAAAELVGRFRPARREELRSIVGKLNRDREGAGPVATLHGDLHLKNLFVSEDRIVLLDLDNLCSGDPLLDLGSFIASLHFRGLIAGWADELVEEISGRFIQSYRAHVDWDLPEAALNRQIAAALIYERAYRCLTKLRFERAELLDEIIDLAKNFAARF